MALPLLALGFGAAGLATKYFNKPQNLNYNFGYDPQTFTADTYNYSADRNYLQNAKTLQGQGVDFLTGQSDMQKGLLSEAYKTSFGLGDQQFNQANTAIAQQGGEGGSGLSRAFRAITRSGAGENYRKSALGIGTSFAGLGLNALQSSLGAYGQMDTTRANVGMYNVGQQNQVGMFNVGQQNEATRYGNQMGYEQMVGNANARAAWGDSIGNSLFDMAGMAMPNPGMNNLSPGGYNTSWGGRVSDISLKENIELVNKSDSGINIYEFDYKDKSHGEGRYRGVMAQEVPQASFRHENGYLAVDYNKVDVDFERID